MTIGPLNLTACILAGALLAAAGLSVSWETGASAALEATDAVNASTMDVSVTGEKSLDENIWISPEKSAWQQRRNFYMMNHSG